MEFPITNLLGPEQSEQWLLEHFHPEGLKCPWCRASVEQANVFRVTRKSELKVYRCKDCKSIYNLFTGTIFQQRQVRPQQVVNARVSYHPPNSHAPVSTGGGKEIHLLSPFHALY